MPVRSTTAPDEPTETAEVEDMPTYKNPQAPIEEGVEDLPSRMTLAEKIGQMTQVEKGSI
jgi:beta-glucosidase